MLFFGSRLDDNRHGGDIDLLLKVPEPLTANEIVDCRTRFTAPARLYRLLEKRRIDGVMAQLERPDPREVVAAARLQGVELART